MQFDERVSTADGTVHIRALTASGTQMVKVYFDGVLDQEQSHEVQFT